MCDPVSLVSGAVGLYQKNQVDKAAQQQQKLLDEQNQMNADAKAEMDALERSRNVDKIDLEADSAESEQRRLKKNRMALQQGMLGTIKTDPLNMNAAVATQKTTLGT